MININTYSGRTTNDILDEMAKDLNGKKLYIEQLSLAYNPNSGKMEAIIIFSE